MSNLNDSLNSSDGAGRPVGQRADSGEVAAQVKRDARELKDAAKRRARATASELQSEGREGAEKALNESAGEVDRLAQAVDAAADSLSEDERDGLAAYATQLSSGMANFAAQLRERSVDNLALEARRFARDNPSAFMLGSVVVGFGLARFFKASGQRDGEADAVAGDAGETTAGARPDRSELAWPPDPAATTGARGNGEDER